MQCLVWLLPYASYQFKTKMKIKIKHDLTQTKINKS